MLKTLADDENVAMQQGMTPVGEPFAIRVAGGPSSISDALLTCAVKHPMLMAGQRDSILVRHR